jgi:GNAT superfamily N-acetyltransferase
MEEVQQEYVVRYGDTDRTPVDPAQFARPWGLFVVGYLDGGPVACGGWRAQADPPDGLRPTDAEIKRMYVAQSARGNGFARAVLAELERTATAAGRKRSVLETGLKQPEAIALYQSSGYTEIPKFGIYRHDALSVCFGKELTIG